MSPEQSVEIAHRGQAASLLEQYAVQFTAELWEEIDGLAERELRAPIADTAKLASLWGRRLELRRVLQKLKHEINRARG